jgi:hypothetical protein
VEQHDDVEGQVVPDQVADQELGREGERHRGRDGQARGHEEAHRAGEHVGDGVDDAVAVVVERDRALAVALDDRVRVLGDLPGHLGQHRQEQAPVER